MAVSIFLWRVYKKHAGLLLKQLSYQQLGKYTAMRKATYIRLFIPITVIVLTLRGVSCRHLNPP
jgi:hypothetical protein